MKVFAPLATTVAAAAFLTAGAVAQTTPPPTPATPPAQTQTTPTAPAASVTQQSANQWRSSRLIGLDVYNNENEKVGDVTELITNANGQVEAVVVGVGGFLGIGRHDVALRWEDLRFVNEPRPTPAADKRTTTPNAATPPAATAPTANREVPDHAVISMTRDQLKAMPAFKYSTDKT